MKSILAGSLGQGFLSLALMVNNIERHIKVGYVDAEVMLHSINEQVTVFLIAREYDKRVSAHGRVYDHEQISLSFDY